MSRLLKRKPVESHSLNSSFTFGLKIKGTTYRFFFPLFLPFPYFSLSPLSWYTS